MAQNTPKPDDRSDNVEKSQSMIHHTIENMEDAEAAMVNSSPEDQQRIKEKMNAAARALMLFGQKSKMKRITSSKAEKTRRQASLFPFGQNCDNIRIVNKVYKYSWRMPHFQTLR